MTLFLAAIFSFFAHESLADRFMENHPVIAHKTRLGNEISNFNEKLKSIPHKPNWDNVVLETYCYTWEDAFEIASLSEDIEYFFYTNGLADKIIDSEGNEHTLFHGLCVFFTGDLPEWNEDRKITSFYKCSYN
ncbi:MAG: hypothetical protein SNF33_08135 [Candidatus Algichlamydia australiensis]|nr:hypothetical protein [Chlamydiales bacterium]